MSRKDYINPVDRRLHLKPRENVETVDAAYERTKHLARPVCNAALSYAKRRLDFVRQEKNCKREGMRPRDQECDHAFLMALFAEKHLKKWRARYDGQLIGPPPPPKMKRGTAIKWVEVLRGTDWKYDCSHLCFEDDNGKLHGSAVGVLCHFMDPHGWRIAWDGASRAWDGETMYPPDRLLKRAKVRGDLWFVDDLSYSFAQAAELVERTFVGGNAEGET